MRLRNLITITLMVILTGNAAVTLLPAEGNSTARVRFKLPAFSVDTVTVEGVSYSRISSADLEAVTLEKGAPELPYSATALKLSGSGDVSLHIQSVKYREIEVLPVIPSKGVLTRNINPSEVALIKGESYNSSDWFPNNSVKLEAPYQIRDIRGVAARIYPFSYNPSTGMLRVADEITFSISEKGSMARSVRRETSEEFKSVAENRFLNNSSDRPLMLRYNPVYDGDKMLVITAAEYQDAAEKFASWKNRKGISTEVYTYPSETGDGVSALKSFIQSKFDENRISYVTLVGDWEDIPSKLRDYSVPGDYPSQDDDDVSSDPSYTYLQGNDTYPDIFIGRISVSSARQAETVVNKILNYEMYPEVGASWYEKAVSIGSNEGTPRDYQWLTDSINPVLLNSHYSEVNTIYQDFGESNSQLSSYINEGRGLVNFMGHGNNESFLFSRSAFRYRQSDISALQNGSRLPVVVPLACQFGTFKGRTVVSETWLRHPDGGAVAVMGSTPLMDWTPPQYAQVEMSRLISENAHSSMGAYFYNGEMKMLDVSRGTKTMNTWTYFGDPSLQFITAAPSNIELSLSGDLALGTNSITVSGEDDVLVTIYSKTLNIQKSQYIINGRAELTVNIADTGKIYITGTKRNSAPWIDSLDVAAVAEENTAPTDIALSNDSIMAGAINGTLIGRVTAVDANLRDSHTFTMDSSTNNSLSLHGDSIIVSGVLDEGTDTVIISAVDEGGLSVSRELTVTITENPYFSLIKSGSWSSAADSIGSNSILTVDSLSEIPVSISASIFRDENPAYTKWANITTSFTGDITEVDEVYLTYSATDSIKVVFPMAELSESGAGHYILLPATAERGISTIKFTAADLRQPKWTDSGDSTVFDAASVQSVSIELASEDTTEARADITIHALGLKGYQQPVNITSEIRKMKPAGITVNSVNRSGMKLGVPSAGDYRIELFSMNGRRLFSVQQNLSAGYHQIPLNNSASGVAILRVNGPKGALSMKTLLK